MMEDNNEQARNWAMWCHLSSIAWILAFIIPFPFLNILCPLIVWLSKKNQNSFINAHGKESLNFQLSLLIYTIICAIILLFLTSVTCGWIAPLGSSSAQSSITTIGVSLLIGLIGLYVIGGIISFALVIFAAVKAKKGEFYHYPFTIRFLK
ncbi:MAG TPA: DUF4870 domain-containing protein [Kamptonema sp.]|nr:DUF4870 domain-containing protein [Kamptonema sp.]